MAQLNEIARFLDELLEVETVSDNAHNGLQVGGKDEVRRVALATDAALAVYRKADEAGCDMVLAHHGIVWGGLRSVTGRIYEHVKFLVDHGMSLYASHLPLDKHPEVGNNAELVRLAALSHCEPFGDYHGVELGFAGQLARPMSLDELAQLWTLHIGGTPTFLRFGKERVQRIGLVSGGGSSAMAEAIAKGLDCFVTGEGEQPDYHLALEGRMNVIYLGHYRSETLGVKALGPRLTERFGVETVFIDEPTGF